MSDELAMPTALDELEYRLKQPSEDDLPAIAQALRVLQRFGLTRQELTVHVERLRAVNESSSDDLAVEDACLQALELIDGRGRMALEWSPSVTATAWLPRALDREALLRALPYALAPSDLLPRRPQLLAAESQVLLVDRLWSMLDGLKFEPTRAEFFRSPKNGLTTRPAALLAPHDRLVFESLAEIIGSRLGQTSPGEVIWPRGRDSHGEFERFSQIPLEWRSEFVVRTDIESFFEGVEHSILAVVASRTLSLSGAFSVALEAHLDTVMNASVGLPQGPPGSDLLASAYLLDIDLKLRDLGWEFARYSDDFMFGADSVVDARSRLRALEAMLLERGLRLSVPKTRVVRNSTYRRQLGSTSPRIERFRSSIRDAIREQLLASNDSKEIEDLLTNAGADEQVLWDLMYHHTVSIEEVIEQLGGRLDPSEAEAYARFFESSARRLDSGEYPDQVQAEERELRECLLVMSATNHPFDLRLLHAVLDWMPTLVHDVSFYLESMSDHDTEAVAKFLTDRYGSGRDSDLETAWLLSATLSSTALVGALFDTVMVAAIDEALPLTRTVAVRALAIGGALSEDIWTRALRESPAALGAELLFALAADSGIFPEDGPNRELPELPTG